MASFARCTLEVFVGGRWQTAAEIRCADPRAGHESASKLDYDPDYLSSLEFRSVRDARAVSCRYPTTWELFSDDKWPAFLLDLIPSGAARRYWEQELGLPNNQSSDWEILCHGAGNPPGNVRVAEAAAALVSSKHRGFERHEVLERAGGFIEYARSRGAAVAGASGAAGDAPKFLLCEDVEGRWHADASLPDERTQTAWLVKFPRSSREADRLVLEAEAPLLRVAKRLGARVARPAIWEEDCLFVPRFDRSKRGATVERRGMESLCSLAGVTEFGAPIAKELLASKVFKYTTEPQLDLREFLLRDVLDVALGNTDNHARNTAVLKDENGTVALAPLYDFAPMVLDPQGIARVCRWKDEEDGFPLWGRVVERLEALGIDRRATREWLRGLAGPVRSLPKTMREERVPPSVIEVLEPRTARVADMLEEAR